MEWNIGIYIGVAFLGVFVLYLLRELFCWYWKINEIRNLLQKILDRLPEKKETRKQDLRQSAPNEPVDMKKIEIHRDK